MQGNRVRSARHEIRVFVRSVMFRGVTQTYIVVVCRMYGGGVETRGTQQQKMYTGDKRDCHEPRIVRENLSQEQFSPGMVGLE